MKTLFLAAGLLALASTAAQAQSSPTTIVEELPGGIERPLPSYSPSQISKPLSANALYGAYPTRSRPAYDGSPPAGVGGGSPQVSSRFSAQSIVYHYGRGGYRHGYGDSFPRGNGFGGPRPIYRGGWLMPHRFSGGRGHGGYGRSGYGRRWP